MIKLIMSRFVVIHIFRLKLIHYTLIGIGYIHTNSMVIFIRIGFNNYLKYITWL